MLLHACTTLDVYEKTASAAKHEWQSSNSLAFYIQYTGQHRLLQFLFCYQAHRVLSLQQYLDQPELCFSKPETTRTQRFNIELANAE
jgi:hypothetical protein